MKVAVKTLSVVACMTTALIASVCVSAGDTDLTQWEIHELPFPSYDNSYSTNLDVAISADGTQYFFTEWYEGFAFGDGEWNLVDLSDTIDGLDLHLDYISYAVDGGGNIHFVAQTYLDKIVYGTDAGGEWTTVTVDNIGMTGGGWSYVPKPKILVDDQGSAHLCYHNMDDGHELRYATNAQGNWTSWSIGNALNSSSNYEIELDASGVPHIIYWNYDTLQLLHVTQDGDEWTVEPVTTADSDSYARLFALDVSEDGRAHVLYGLSVSPPHEIYSWTGMYCAVESEAGWEETLIEGKWSESYGYADASGQLDSNGVLHVCYSDSYDSDLIYANNMTGTFEKQRVDSVDHVGLTNALTVDSDDNVHIAYLNETSKTAKYAFGNATAISSTADGGEDLFPVVTAVTLAATGVAAVAIVAWRPRKTG